MPGKLISKAYKINSAGKVVTGEGTEYKYFLSSCTGAYVRALTEYGEDMMVMLTSEGKLKIMLHNKEFVYSRSSIEIDDYAKPKPTIGMTTEEVRATKWGKPTDINKDTYSWGTTEQWCYSNDKYVYFENGICTAIQE